ncbi:MAG: hypothetical protein AAFR14_01290 [Bacteroidota bacterium]
MFKKLFCCLGMALFVSSLTAQKKLELETDVRTGNDRIMALLTNIADGNQALTALQLDSGVSSNITTTQLVSHHNDYTAVAGASGMTGITNIGSGIFLRTLATTGKLRFFVGTSVSPVASKMSVATDGVGFGTDDPKAPVHVAGNLYVDQDGGLILKSASNTCFSIEVSTSGILSTSSVTCP